MGRYENFSKNNRELETFWKTFEHCGMKSSTYFSMGYETLSTITEGYKTVKQF